MVTRTPVQKCPNCSHPLDGHLSVGGDRAMKAGDVGICIECGHIFRYTDELELVSVSAEKLKELGRKGLLDYKLLMRAVAHIISRIKHN